MADYCWSLTHKKICHGCCCAETIKCTKPTSFVYSLLSRDTIGCWSCLIFVNLITLEVINICYLPSLLLVEEYTLQNFSIYYFFNNFKSLKHLSNLMHVQWFLAQTVHNCTDNVCFFHVHFTFVIIFRPWGCDPLRA